MSKKKQLYAFYCAGPVSEDRLMKAMDKFHNYMKQNKPQTEFAIAMYIDECPPNIFDRLAFSSAMRKVREEGAVLLLPTEDTIPRAFWEALFHERKPVKVHVVCSRQRGCFFINVYTKTAFR